MAKSLIVQLRVQPPTHQALKRLSLATGQPMCSIVTVLLKDSIPSFEALAELLETVQKGRVGEAKRSLAAFMLEKADDLVEASDDLIENPSGRAKLHRLFFDKVEKAKK